MVQLEHLLQELKLKIVCVDTLKPLPPNQVGELWVRGPILMPGMIYVNQILPNF